MNIDDYEAAIKKLLISAHSDAEGIDARLHRYESYALLQELGMSSQLPPMPLQDSSATQLDLEMRRARTKFPGNRFLFTALVEEVGELAQAILQKKNPDEIRKEALQCACVAMRIFEEGDPAYGDLTEAESKK